MHCLIKEISIFWQSSFGLCDFFPKGTDIAPGFFRTAILFLDVFFTHLTFFIYFLECQILNVSFLAESSGDQRGNKMGLKQVAGKAHMGWHSHGKLFFFPAGVMYQSLH